MPLTFDHPLICDAPELFTLLTSWGKDPNKLQGSEKLQAAINAADYRNDIFSDPQYPEFALLALHQDKISEAQFATIMSLWAANEDYQPHIVEHRITSSDPFAKENQILYQFLMKTADHSDGFKKSISRAQFKIVLEKMLDAKTPTSEKSYFTFELRSFGLEKTEIAKRIADISFATFMPRRSKSSELYIDIYIIPSHSLVQSFIDCCTSKPVRLQPVIGETSAKNVLHNHTADSHPVGISFPDFNHEYADTLRSGKLGFIYHDYYHAILISSNLMRAAFNYIAQLTLEFIARYPENSERLETISQLLIDQEIRIYGSGFDELNPDNLTDIFYLNLLRILVDPKQIEDKQKALASQDEDVPMKQRIDQVINALELDSVAITLFKFIFADLINNAELWQSKFGISPTEFHQSVLKPRHILASYLADKKGYLLGQLYSGYSDEEIQIRVFDKLLSLTNLDVLNPNQYLTASGKQWFVQAQLRSERLKQAILADNVSVFIETHFGLMDCIAACIQHKANQCLAHLLKNNTAHLIFGVNHKSLLHLCVEAKNYAAAVLLCQHGTQVDVVDETQRTPFEYFLLAGEIEAAIACLQREVATNNYLKKIKENYQMPETGSDTPIKVLPEASLKLIADYCSFQAEIVDALCSQKIDRVKKVLKTHPNFNLNTPLEKPHNFSFSLTMNSDKDIGNALMIVIKENAVRPNIQFIKDLLQLGFNPQVENRKSFANSYVKALESLNQTASQIGFAQKKLDQDYFDFLCTLNSSNLLIDQIKIAFTENNETTLSTLLKRLPTNSSLSAYDFLIGMDKYPNMRCFELLLQHGFDLNQHLPSRAIFRKYMSAWSIFLGSKLPIELLMLCVRYGADVNAVGVNNETALGVSIQHYLTDRNSQNLANIRMLLEYGADPNSQYYYSVKFETDDPLTAWLMPPTQVETLPLNEATKISDMPLIGLLLEFDADCNNSINSKSGLTIAKEMNNSVLVLAFENPKQKARDFLPPYAKTKITTGQYRDLSRAVEIIDPKEACAYLETLLANITQTFENYGQFSKAEIKALAGLLQSESDFDAIEFGGVMAVFVIHLAELKNQSVMPVLVTLRKELHDLVAKSPENAEISKFRYRCVTELEKLNVQLDDFARKNLSGTIVDKKPEKLALVKKALFFQVCPELQEDEKSLHRYRGLAAQ